eukprot:11740-Eustigmatos_ZCMA.PRE.1
MLEATTSPWVNRLAELVLEIAQLELERTELQDKKEAVEKKHYELTCAMNAIQWKVKEAIKT